MNVAGRLALLELWHRRWNTLALTAVFGLAVTIYLALSSYRLGVLRDHPLAQQDFLVVQESQSFGEFYGSRLPPKVAGRLEAQGVTDWVPEIHTIVGTSPRDVVLLRGVSLPHYRELDAFELVAGRPLTLGDPPRAAMIGGRLAEMRGVSVGGFITLRGRRFQVVGIFETGSYTENEAWVPLAGAQALLGWGEDVSVYVVPDDGRLQAGQELGPGVSIGRRGELWSDLADQWLPMLDLVGAVTTALGLAAAGSLAVVLWRVAWDRSWQAGVLRAIGFSRRTLVGYFGLQGAAVGAGGGLVGTIGALALTRLVRVNVVGFTADPGLPLSLLLGGFAWLAALTAAGVLLPALWLSSQSLTALLRER